MQSYNILLKSSVYKGFEISLNAEMTLESTIIAALVLLAATYHCTSALAAFSVPATCNAHGQMPLKLREIRKEFHFSTIPYEQGLKNIHSLERLLQIHHTYFQIHSTTEPVYYGKYIVVSARCSIKSRFQQDIRMFSDQPNTSHIICLKEGVPQMMFKVNVSPAYYGHTVTISASTYLHAPRWINMILSPLWYFLLVFENSLRREFNAQNDENLVKYRKMVFNQTLSSNNDPE